MGLWDLTFKVLVRTRPQDLLQLLPDVDTTRRLRPIDKEFAAPPPMPRALDALLEYEDDTGHGSVFHFEFEAEPGSDGAFRAFEHWFLARLLLRRPVRTVVVYLNRGKARRRPQSRYHGTLNGREQVTFRFEAIALWKLEACSVLEMPAPALWSAVALCQGATLEDVRAAFRQLETVEDAHARQDLEAVLYWIAGTRFERTDLLSVVPKEVLMRSSTYEATLEEGRQEARQESAAMLRRLCMSLLRQKAQANDGDAEKLSSIREPERLEALAQALIGASDANAARGAFLEAIRAGADGR